MMPIGYTCDDRVLSNLPLLLNKNGIDDCLRENEREGKIFRNHNGDVALVAKDGFIESYFNLSDDHDLRLHAALIASGCAHSGHHKLSSWPSSWFIGRKVWDPHKLTADLRAKRLASERNFARIVLGGYLFLFGVAVNAFGGLATFVCLDQESRQTAGGDSLAWDNFVSIVSKLDFEIEMNPQANQ